MALNVGQVIDLPFEPFYIDMERRGFTLAPVALKDAPQALRDGEIDAAPVSLVDGFGIEDICDPVAGFCLSAVKRATSSLLYSKKPLEELSGGVVATSTDSTTRKLFQVLLSKLHQGQAGDFVELPEEHDAFTVAWDDALRRRRGVRGYEHRYDLGEQWNNMTKLPFVFARWFVKKEATKEDILVLEDTLYVGLEDGVDSLYHLSEPKDHLLMMAKDITEYIMGYRYFVGHSERKSIELFKEYLDELSA
ncbi:MAG: hypothetical protein FI717_03525 [SAR202 cluster bacterium]|nr:hypothetical protein [Chloroflexota bacterium]MQG33354.1 hypothetical protein [SAR202 cluster bacterium]|tara:strand:- start:306 stop:1052 length:747 start_codon:yes stop_codon:yes gene_type:complete